MQNNHHSSPVLDLLVEGVRKPIPEIFFDLLVNVV